MLYYVLYGLFLIACVVMIAAVMLQPGKADAGALFTSNISSTAFGARGTQSVLAKITIGAATAFMLFAFVLTQPALTGSRSVLQTTDAPADEPAPAASPAASVEPTATDANANSPANPTDSPAANK